MTFPSESKSQEEICLKNSSGSDILNKRRQRVLDTRYHSVIRAVDDALEKNPFLFKARLKIESREWAEYLCERLNADGIQTMLLIDGIFFPDYYLLMNLHSLKVISEEIPKDSY